MSEAKFTEGDWYLALDDFIWSGSTKICKVYCDGVFLNRGAKANARLIESAPEMYTFIESLQLSVGDDMKREELLAKARGEL